MWVRSGSCWEGRASITAEMSTPVQIIWIWVHYDQGLWATTWAGVNWSSYIKSRELHQLRLCPFVYILLVSSILIYLFALEHLRPLFLKPGEQRKCMSLENFRTSSLFLGGVRKAWVGRWVWYNYNSGSCTDPSTLLQYAAGHIQMSLYFQMNCVLERQYGQGPGLGLRDEVLWLVLSLTCRVTEQISPLCACFTSCPLSVLSISFISSSAQELSLTLFF